MHAKSGLRVLLEWKINRPDSVITAVIRPNSMRISLANLLWVFVAVSAFLAGLLLQTVRDPLTPVLVASRNIDEYELLDSTDFEMEYRRASNVPFGVLTDMAQIQEMHVNRKLRVGQYVFPDDLSDFVGHVHLPEGKCVAAIRVDLSKHSLALHLFSQGDRVSLYYVPENRKECSKIADSLTIFSVNELPTKNGAIVLLMVTEEQKHAIYSAQENGKRPEFIFDRPVKGE